jgi:hypothetical protein
MLQAACFKVERCVLYNAIRLTRLRGVSERVARGFTIGMVVNFFPTFGFGVLLSGVVARVLGGNAVAGFVGGASLGFFWPVLFYLNVRVGSLFHKPKIVIDDLDDVTTRTMDALVWGKAFTFGAVINSVLVGVVVYTLLRLFYEQMRPLALAYFRRHSKDHQRRFRRRDFA